MNLDEALESSQQSFESLALDSGNGNGKHRLSSNFDELSDLSQPDFADDDEIVSRSSFGVSSNSGGRPYQDDRSTAFCTRLPDGTRVSVGAVLDGHHGHQISDLITDKLPIAFIDGINKWPADLESALAATIRSLDDIAFEAHISGRLPTGGTTLIVHVIAGNLIYTANVGDCKAILSSRGAPEALSEAHNPPVESEKKRFSSAGVSIFSDHIEGSDINVCRTIGDYDLGPPLKWRDTSTGALCGPLISEPEISVRAIEPTDEFLVVATDGLWDYYTPESSVITQSRQKLRANNNDPQLTANWLVVEALQRQRGTLHAGTPGDNVTVMVIRLRLLPAIPRTSTSRLNLRRAPSDADSQKTN